MSCRYARQKEQRFKPWHGCRLHRRSSRWRPPACRCAGFGRDWWHCCFCSSRVCSYRAFLTADDSLSPSRITKAELEPGRAYTFEVAVSNTGVLPSSPITLSALPAGAPLHTSTLFPIAPLSPGGSADIVFEVQLPVDAPTGQIYQGTVSVRSGTDSYPLHLHFTCGTNVSGSLVVEAVDEVGAGEGGWLGE